MSCAASLAGSERVLVRLPSWLGDFVMAEPVLRALERRVARGALTLVGLAPHLALLDGRLAGARRVALEARDGDAPRLYAGHDVALLLNGSFRSAFCAWRARVPRRVGFARDGRGALLTDALRPARERGGVPLELGRAGGGRRHLPRPLGRSLVELMGLVGVPVEHAQPRLDVSAPALRAARARRAALGLDPDGPFALVSVGGRADSAKSLPAELWARALRALRAAHADLPLLLVCAPGEEPALAAVLAALGREPAAALRDPAAGLAELLGHLSEARLFLGADAGPRHLARALGRAALIVAGPTDPRHCALGARERLLRVSVPCGPCHRERCPLAGAEHQCCMTAIEPARFVAAAHELLALGPAMEPE